LRQRFARIAALLGTVVYQAVFANVEIARAGAATPMVLAPLRNVVLEIVDARVAALLHRAHRGVNLALLVAQRLQLAAAIVDDPHGRREAQLERAPSDR